MSKRRPVAPATDRDPPEVDITKAHASRIYDYLLGGTDWFEVDRLAAEQGFEPYPGGVDGARADARTNRRFLHDSVEYLVRDAGLRQFLDIGTGIPGTSNVHAVAQAIAPETKVVYSDNDPIVLAHAHQLRMQSDGGGITDYIHGDFLDPEPILHKAAETLDFGQPIGLMLVGLLHVIPESDRPHEVVARLVGALPSGSYMAISQFTTDFLDRDMAAVLESLSPHLQETNPPAWRTRAEVAQFFDGLELVGPGVCPADRWTPRGEAPAAPGRTPPLCCALGRKP